MRVNHSGDLKSRISMNITQAKKEITSLTKQIEAHNHRYYVLDQPSISDQEYDELLYKLIKLEEDFPQLKTLSSPSQRVGSKIEGHLPVVNHRIKMLSLDNTYSSDELKAWYERVTLYRRGGYYASTGGHE